MEEESVTDNPQLQEISCELARFLETAAGLETFVPGLYVRDRAHYQLEPRTLSLCYR